MGRHALHALLLLSLIVFNGSDASFFGELRKLVALDPKDNKPATHDSPLPTPKPVGETKKNTQNPNGSNNNNNNNNNNNTISPASPPLANNTAPPASGSPVAKKDGDGKIHEEEKKKNEGKIVSQSTTSDTCDGLKTCTDEGNMLACISKIDSEHLVVVLQNRGDGTIKVKLRTESNLGDIEVGKHQTEKISISLITSGSTRLTLDAGKGDCVLHMGTLVPEGNIFLRLPSYDKILTPVNGAYFLILTVIVFGGTWACCKLRKKRHDEVPYQELEMGLPESVLATNVESAEGWDQGWDDDWDEDVAVKSPAVHHAGSISANGLTSRSSNRDGWENNWDD